MIWSVYIQVKTNLLTFVFQNQSFCLQMQIYFKLPS